MVQVAKTSQGLIPPPFSISNAKVHNKALICNSFTSSNGVLYTCLQLHEYLA